MAGYAAQQHRGFAIAQQLNRLMIATARLLEAIDAREISGVSDELVAALTQTRDTFWSLKMVYPEYATDQRYKIAQGTGEHSVQVVGKSQLPSGFVATVAEGFTYPDVIVIDDDNMG